MFLTLTLIIICIKFDHAYSQWKSPKIKVLNELRGRPFDIWRGTTKVFREHIIFFRVIEKQTIFFPRIRRQFFFFIKFNEFIITFHKICDSRCWNLETFYFFTKQKQTFYSLLRNCRNLQIWFRRIRILHLAWRKSCRCSL